MSRFVALRVLLSGSGRLEWPLDRCEGCNARARPEKAISARAVSRARRWACHARHGTDGGRARRVGRKIFPWHCLHTHATPVRVSRGPIAPGAVPLTSGAFDRTV